MMEKLNLIQYFKYNGLAVCSLLFFIFVLATSVSNFKDEKGKINYGMVLFLTFYAISIALEIFLPFSYINNLFSVSIVYRAYAIFVIFSHIMLLVLCLKFTGFLNIKNRNILPITYLLIFSVVILLFSLLPGNFDSLPCSGPIQKCALFITLGIDISLFLVVLLDNFKNRKKSVIVLSYVYVLFSYFILVFLCKKFNLVVANPTIFITMIFYHFILIFENRDTDYNQRLVNKIRDTTLINDSKRVFTEKFMSSIKIPMHNIIGLSSVLKEDNYNNNLEDNIKIITKSNAVLNNKIEEVREINNIISGNTKLDEKDYNLKELVDRLENNTNKQINNNKFFKVVSNVDLDINLVGDSDKIYKTLYYVISLAIENTLEGDIILDFNINFNKNVCNLDVNISNPGNKISKEIFDKKFIDFANSEENIYDIKEELLIAKYYADILLSPISLINNDNDTKYNMSIDQLVSNRGE